MQQVTIPTLDLPVYLNPLLLQRNTMTLLQRRRNEAVRVFDAAEGLNEEHGDAAAKKRDCDTLYKRALNMYMAILQYPEVEECITEKGQALLDVAICLCKLGLHKEAEVYHRKHLQIRESESGTADTATLRAALGLANTLLMGNKIEECRQVCSSSLEVLEKLDENDSRNGLMADFAAILGLASTVPHERTTPPPV